MLNMNKLNVSILIAVATIMQLSCRDNSTGPVATNNVLLSSSFEHNGIPSFDNWQTLDTAAMHFFSFSRDVPSTTEIWSLMVSVDSTVSHSLTNRVNISYATDNDLFVLTYRAKCVGRADAIAGLGVVFGLESYSFLDFINDSAWTLFSDTIAVSSRATAAEVSLSVDNKRPRLTFQDLIHPVHYDSNYVLFDDFRLVQQSR
jgi:hypothetical protein